MVSFNYSNKLVEQPREIIDMWKGHGKRPTSIWNFHSSLLCMCNIVGEIEAARVKNVHLYVAQKIKAQSKKKKSKLNQSSRIGLLIITNFRLSFVAFDEHDKGKVSELSAACKLDQINISYISSDVCRRTPRSRRTNCSASTTSPCPTSTRYTLTPTKSKSSSCQAKRMHRKSTPYESFVRTFAC